MKTYLVFDWGGTSLKYALMNEETDILKKGHIASPPKSADKEKFFQAIDPIIMSEKERICGIAISSTGIFDSQKGIVKTIGAFPYLDGMNIHAEFERRYNLGASIENDAKCAALAEMWKGRLMGIKDGAVMILGTSIGGGLILDGRLRRGAHSSAGEFSGICTNIEDPENNQSWFAELGYKGLASAVSEYTNESLDDLTGIEIFNRVRKGEEKTIQGLRKYCAKLAVMIFSLNMVLDLEKIVIGGGISESPFLLQYLQEAIGNLQEIQPDLKQGTKLPLPVVDVCQFHNDANLIGALYHFLYE